MFDLNLENVHTIMEAIRSKGLKATSLADQFDLPDSSDEPFLEAALAATADVLITGNRKHFPKRSCKGQMGVTPTEFLSLFSK